MHLVERFSLSLCFHHSSSCHCTQIHEEIWEDENISLVKSPKKQNNVVTIEKQDEVQVSAL
jgi:hypothetical protein